MSQRLNNLNEIIAVLKSGAEFYRRASRQSEKEDLAQLYIAHAELREEASVELSRVVDDAGHEPADPSSKEKSKAAMTGISAAFMNTDESLVSGLEEHEDRTLAVFRDAIQHPDNERDVPMLQSYMDAFQQSHDKMKALKNAA